MLFYWNIVECLLLLCFDAATKICLPTNENRLFQQKNWKGPSVKAATTADTKHPRQASKQPSTQGKPPRQSASMKTGYFNRETGKALQLRLPPLLTPSTQGKQASNQGNAISATILLSLLLTSLLMPSLLLSSNNLRQLQGFHYLLIENTMFVKITCIYL